MREIRDAIVHLSARKLSDWFADRRTINHGSRRARNALSRALREAEDEIEEASEFISALSGNEMTRLLDDIADAADRSLRRSE